jgi:hypothetical protein
VAIDPVERNHLALVFLPPQQQLHRGILDSVRVPSGGENEIDDMTIVTTRTTASKAVSVASKPSSSGVIATSLKKPPPPSSTPRSASGMTSSALSVFSGGAPIVGDARSVKSKHTQVTLGKKRKLASSLSAAAVVTVVAHF